MRIDDKVKFIFYMAFLIFTIGFGLWIFTDIFPSHPPMDEITIQTTPYGANTNPTYYSTNKSEIITNPNGDITVDICYSSALVLFKKPKYKEYDNLTFTAGNYILYSNNK